LHSLISFATPSTHWTQLILELGRLLSLDITIIAQKKHQKKHYSYSNKQAGRGTEAFGGEQLWRAEQEHGSMDHCYSILLDPVVDFLLLIFIYILIFLGGFISGTPLFFVIPFFFLHGSPICQPNKLYITQPFFGFLYFMPFMRE
jgi:hypothetical protein